MRFRIILLNNVWSLFLLYNNLGHKVILVRRLYNLPWKLWRAKVSEFSHLHSIHFNCRYICRRTHESHARAFWSFLYIRNPLRKELVFSANRTRGHKLYGISLLQFKFSRQFNYLLVSSESFYVIVFLSV